MPRSRAKGFSLKTQIYGLVIFLGIVSFFGTLLVSVDHTKEYLNEQMSSHAQDTATSLGLSIAPYLASEDIIIVETMVSAIFDSGYYAEMVLTDTDTQQVILSREAPKTVDTVPNWFIDMFKLSPPTRESKINTGWRIAASLSVTSHAGASYYQLWQYALKASAAFSIILVISLVLAYFILNAVLKPLARVEQQAIAVSKKQFNINKKQSITRELNVVVNALNIMVDNVQKNFNSLTNQAEKHTQEAYIDKLTGLGNRRAFDSQFTHHLSEIDDDSIGTVILLELASLRDINQSQGYQAGDAYVLQVVKIVKEAFEQFSEFTFYRINGGSFIVSIPLPLSLCQDELQKVITRFEQLNTEEYPNGFAKLVSTSYKKSDLLKSLLISLDSLLTEQTSTLRKPEYTLDKTSGLSLGLQEWSTLINELIESGRIEFLVQPVQKCELKEQEDEHSAYLEKPFYNELLAKFYYQQDIIPNNQLFAMAERLNLTEQLDIKLITAAAKLVKPDMSAPIAINLSQQSLLSENFCQWLTRFISENNQCRNQVYFEVNEVALLKDINLASKHIHQFKALDIGISIERFGTSLTSFKYINGLDLDFIKIDGSYIRDIDLNKDNAHFVQAVNQICHGLGINVIACHIENENVLNVVKSLACDGCQGDYIQAPKALYVS
ncbi:bifunctional diguanylate cyclase/phosphodiesterase [Litorilituus lipolyticus]|uniref:EAL domain-containing protein n=1 Tax=Litorilituus lipolyticus TaxID=2491017 RepID=A0A502KSW1_9GAMM|nr:EAL domain-containing protein [Litorilituus lipolyticus]TPH14264.1 EAL domain-containing protein [Litorilituus lipolyticus]